MMSNGEKEVLDDFVDRGEISRVRATLIGDLYYDLSRFAKDNGLVLIMKGITKSIIGFEFFDGMNCERSYIYCLLPKRVEDYNEEFMKITHEVAMRLLSEENEPRTDEIDIPTYASALTKQEHIALELTKAWANTRVHGYLDPEDIVDGYQKILEEVNGRLK